MMFVVCMMYLGSSSWFRVRMVVCFRETLRVFLRGGVGDVVRRGSFLFYGGFEILDIWKRSVFDYYGLVDFWFSFYFFFKRVLF